MEGEETMSAICTIADSFTVNDVDLAAFTCASNDAEIGESSDFEVLQMRMKRDSTEEIYSESNIKPEPVTIYPSSNFFSLENELCEEEFIIPDLIDSLDDRGRKRNLIETNDDKSDNTEVNACKSIGNDLSAEKGTTNPFQENVKVEEVNAQLIADVAGEVSEFDGLSTEDRKYSSQDGEAIEFISPATNLTESNNVIDEDKPNLSQEDDDIEIIGMTYKSTNNSKKLPRFVLKNSSSAHVVTRRRRSSDKLNTEASRDKNIKALSLVTQYCGVCNKVVISTRNKCRACQNIMQYQCRKCSERFNIWTDISRHIRSPCSANSNLKAYKCKYCSYTSFNNDRVKQHITRYHMISQPKIVVCQRCSRIFLDSNTKEAQTHLEECRVGYLMCKFCPQLEELEHELRTHMEFIHSNKFKPEEFDDIVNEIIQESERSKRIMRSSRTAV